MSCDRCGGCGQCACAAEPATLAPPSNRPALASIAARLGDYRDFFAAAIAGLSAPERPALRDLGARDPSDPAIAWLDGWAVAADVLTFYRERLTNQSYLRTARDEYALREIAALVGYKPRPGVAATAHLAYLMEATAKPVRIQLHARSQTVPGPGEQMQTFETDEEFEAHADWSQMSPRVVRPAAITLENALLRPAIRLKDASLAIRPGERMLFVFGNRTGFQVVREVAGTKADILGGFVDVALKPRMPLDPVEGPALVKKLARLRDEVLAAAAGSSQAMLADLVASFFLGGSAADSRDGARELEGGDDADVSALASRVAELFDALLGRLPGVTVAGTNASSLGSIAEAAGRQATRQLASGRLLMRSAGQGLTGGGAERLSLLSATTPKLAEALPDALGSLRGTAAPPETAPSIFLLRVSAGAFGAAAPPRFLRDGEEGPEYDMAPEDRQAAFLDAAYDGVQADSFVLFDRPFAPKTTVLAERSTISYSPNRVVRIARVRSAQPVARGSYRISGKSTRLELVRLDDPAKEVLVAPEARAVRSPVDLGLLRSTIFHVQSEAVTLAPEAVEDDVQGDEIELQMLISGLQSGQRIIVAGERTDIRDVNGVPVPGVKWAELAMIEEPLATVDDGVPGDTYHTFLKLAAPLAFTYKRAGCVVYGNVVEASHGEDVGEVLGSGDAAKTGQKFACKRGPLTFATAATTTGVEGSETVRVNGTRYRRVDSLLDSGPADRDYQLETDRDGVGSILFGDGVNGARLPSGTQNVRADYRVGIGPAGNVAAEQISLLTTRPLGVSGVTNPLRASGGAGPDGPERIRRNAPLAARALSPLSRLVGVEDYAEFALRFAGIGHAAAARLSFRGVSLIHVTVAGVDDIPLEPGDDLLTNLRNAYETYGDPSYPVEIGVREMKALMMQAKVTIDPDAEWDLVEGQIRARLLDYFSFDRRELGQPAYLSEAVAAMQKIPGVAWVDVERFGSVSEAATRDEKALEKAVASLGLDIRAPARRAAPDAKTNRILPAELVFALPGVRGLIALNAA
jgi:predicted phage baseplate assembly protein